MLSGKLEELPLVRLLESLMGAGRSGLLKLDFAPFQGQIYFNQGMPLHAEIEHLSGLDALELLAGLRAGRFSFESDSHSIRRTIEPTLQTHSLMLHQFEAWQELELPSDWNNQLAVVYTSVQRLRTHEQTLLEISDGQSIASVLLNPKFAPLESAHLLSRFLRLGLLEIMDATQVEAAQLNVLNLYGQQSGVAILDEQLFNRWRKKFKGGFLVRIKQDQLEATLRPEPRSNLAGRLGLFERDLKRLRLARGAAVEVWPKAV